MSSYMGECQTPAKPNKPDTEEYVLYDAMQANGKAELIHSDRKQINGCLGPWSWGFYRIDQEKEQGNLLGGR